MSKGLPKEMFCRRDYDASGKETDFFEADDNPAGLAEVDAAVMAGRYRLVETVRITAPPQIVVLRKARNQKKNRQ